MIEVMSQGLVRLDWADTMAKRHKNGRDWGHIACDNFYFRHDWDGDQPAQEVAQLDFGDLAGVVTWFSNQTYTPKHIARFARKREALTLNLSPDEPGRLTSTKFLLGGLLKHPDKGELEHEPKLPTNLLDMYALHGNETWVIPASAVTMLEPAGSVKEVVLPHQV